jgi:hypothetical protein
MATNRLYKFRRLDDVTNFLNGCVIGGNINKAQGGGTPASLGAGINGLVGTTLIFTSPSAVTVTFARSDGAGGSAASPGTNPDPYTLLFKDIKKQIEAAATGVLVILDAEQNILIIEKTPASGVAVDKTGTANTLLGFDTATATVGHLYTPGTISSTPPCWTWIDADNSNMWMVAVWA